MFKLKYSLLLIVIYRIMLDITYKYEIAPNFGYMHLEDRSTIISFLNSWLVLLIITYFVLPFLRNDGDIAKSCIGVCLYMIRVVPMTSFIAFMPQDNLYLIYNVLYWILLFLIIEKIPYKRLRNKGSIFAVYFVTIISIFAVLWVSGYYAHFRLHLSLMDVYDLRDNARTFKIPLLLDYIWAATYNIIPILIVYFIVNKKFSIAALLIFVGILNFSINGSKSAFFKILFCLFLFLFHKKNIRKAILPLFVFISVLTVGAYLFLNDVFLSTLITRRVFFVPNQLDTFYYDYICKHVPLYFNTEEFGKLTFLIGEDSFNMFDMRANNGLFSDAYANLGPIGVFVFPIILGIFLNFFCSVCRKHNQAISVFSAIIVVTTLGSSAFTTSLLTHGLLLLLLTIYLMPKSELESINRSKNLFR